MQRNQTLRLDEATAKAYEDLAGLYPKLHGLDKKTSNLNYDLKHASEDEQDEIDEVKLAIQIKTFITRYDKLLNEKNELFQRLKSILAQSQPTEFHGAPSEVKGIIRDIQKIEDDNKADLASVINKNEPKCDEILEKCEQQIQDLKGLFPDVDFDNVPVVITEEDEEYSASADKARKDSTESEGSDDSENEIRTPKAVNGQHRFVNKLAQENAKAIDDAKKVDKSDNPACGICVVL